MKGLKKDIKTTRVSVFVKDNQFSMKTSRIIGIRTTRRRTQSNKNKILSPEQLKGK